MSNNGDDEFGPDRDRPETKAKSGRRPHSPGAPYEVGKNKPPKEHQFKPGNTGGGRKRGSRNRTDFDKLLDQRVKVGEDSLGRPVYKRWREVIDLQLVQQAAQRDLRAIRLVKEFEFKHAVLQRAAGPMPATAAQVAQAQAEEAEKRKLAERLSGRLTDQLEVLAQLRRDGLVELVGGRTVMSKWAAEAARAHRAGAAVPAPDHPGSVGG